MLQSSQKNSQKEFFYPPTNELTKFYITASHAVH